MVLYSGEGNHIVDEDVKYVDKQALVDPIDEAAEVVPSTNTDENVHGEGELDVEVDEPATQDDGDEEEDEHMAEEGSCLEEDEALFNDNDGGKEVHANEKEPVSNDDCGDEGGSVEDEFEEPKPAIITESDDCNEVEVIGESESEVLTPTDKQSGEGEVIAEETESVSKYDANADGTEVNVETESEESTPTAIAMDSSGGEDEGCIEERNKAKDCYGNEAKKLLQENASGTDDKEVPKSDENFQRQELPTVALPPTSDSATIPATGAIFHFPYKHNAIHAVTITVQEAAGIID